MTIVYKPTRGERNNNPGNIRLSVTNWKGEIVGTDKAFERFDTPESGIRALSVILRTYYSKYKLNTIKEIINRWAPPVENDTDSYVDAVCEDCGVLDGDTIVDLTIPDTLFKLVKAIIIHENGRCIYTDEQIKAAIVK